MGDTSFAARLRALRSASGLTRTELARLAHITEQSVRNLERGACCPFAPTLQRLAKALGVGWEEFENCRFPDQEKVNA
jgi:transcriptional regulator with XRE-family HTH domain